MEFKIIRYKKSFKVLRTLVMTLILLVVINLIFFNLEKDESNDFYFLLVGIILIVFKWFYFFSGYYRVEGVVAINKDSFIVNGHEYKNEVSIKYCGNFGMTRLMYFPFFFMLYFYYPKSGRSIFFDGINTIKLKTKKIYFLSESDDDFKKLNNIVKMNDNKIKLTKCCF